MLFATLILREVLSYMLEAKLQCSDEIKSLLVWKMLGVLHKYEGNCQNTIYLPEYNYKTLN